MNKQQKIALIRSIVSVWGGFSPSELYDVVGVCVGKLGNLVGLVEYLSMDCVDVSVYSPYSFYSGILHDYTLKYEEATDEVLDELVSLCKKYNEQMLEQQEE